MSSIIWNLIAIAEYAITGAYTYGVSDPVMVAARHVAEYVPQQPDIDIFTWPLVSFLMDVAEVLARLGL